MTNHQEKTVTFRDPFCVRGSLSDRYPTTDTHTVLDQVYGDKMARACCTNVQARKELYNKGGHSILEVKFNLTYKPRPKPTLGPKPDYTLLRKMKPRS